MSEHAPEKLAPDGGSYSRDPVTGELTCLEPATLPPVFKSVAAAQALAEAPHPKPSRKASGAKE